ncbi:MAG: hypothetical protein R3195_12470, partial [Gemmatimonadota bacterium]|nr:hypothetical protein [Gemmatimonadota bacterium]
YRVPALQPGGPYTIRIQLIGYRPEARENIRVTLTGAEAINFTLQTSAVAVDELTVSVESDPVFSAARTGQETTIPNEEIESFPTIQRQITSLAALSPEVNIVEGAPSIAGQNNRFNNIQIDGSVNNDVFGLADSGIPGGQVNAKAISFEAIEEFQVLTAPFDVRHSNFTGGLINAVTKSGTNEWEGSGFVYYSNDGFVSDLDGDPFGEFDDSQFGWTLGGPIVRDKLFLFTNGEFQINSQPTNPPFVPLGGPIDLNAEEANVAPDSAARFADILTAQGFDAVGTSDQISVDNPRTNLFARLDWNISESNRALFRWNYSRARQDGSPFRAPFSLGYTSNGYDFLSNTNSFVGQLFSQLGTSWDNDLLVSFESIRDNRDPVVPWAAVEVDVRSDFGGGDIRSTTLVAGAEEFSQLNQLNQDIFQLTDNLTTIAGRHTLTLGTHNELFSFSNAFVPQSIGVYTFDSLADLENGVVNDYTLTEGINDFNGFADWSFLSLGLYAQDQWQMNDNLSLTLGLRADFPVYLDTPRANPEFEQGFGFGTDQTPGGVSFQPRAGFNWNSLGERQTQIRGGIGLFSGRPPFVWLSNMYSNTGADLAQVNCTGANAPALDPSNYPGGSPNTCLDGSGAQTGSTFINVTDTDFNLPLDMKISLGIDRELAEGWTLTLEGLYTKAVEQVFFREINIPTAQVGVDPTQGNRPVFGSATADGFAPDRPVPSFNHVVEVTNASKNRAILLSGSLNRQFTDWLGFRGSYTWSDVEDLQSLFSSQATSNYGRTPIRGNPNDPELATSAFEVKHKVVGSATGIFELGGGFDVELTPQLYATSGPAYSYIARGDLNGDGYRNDGSPSISRDNDLIYVPNDVAAEMSFRTPADAEAFEDLIAEESCLSEARGTLLKRNTCSSPFQTLFNMRVVLGLPGGWSRGRAEIVADVFNIFGTEVSQPSNIDRGVEVLRLRGRDGDGDGVADGDPNGALLFDYTGPRRDSDGTLDPYTTLDRRSRRIFQIGLRYRF